MQSRSIDVRTPKALDQAAYRRSGSQVKVLPTPFRLQALVQNIEHLMDLVLGDDQRR